MPHKYIPAGRKEINLFRHDKAMKERRRKTITDETLIALRRVHLNLQKINPEFEHKAQQIVIKLKALPNKRVVDIFNYYLSNIN